MDVIIVGSICINIVQQTLTTTHTPMMATQEKTWLYIEQAPSDDFIPLLLRRIGVFILILIHFLTACAHTIIVCCQQSSQLVPSMLVSYYQ